MRVRLTRKLAECVDGVDLSGYREGDVLTLSPREAQLLIAEGWAVRVPSRDVRGRSIVPPKLAQAADRLQARSLDARVHDELHDVHARIVQPPVNPTPER